MTKVKYNDWLKIWLLKERKKAIARLRKSSRVGRILIQSSTVGLLLLPLNVVSPVNINSMTVYGRRVAD